MNKVIRVLAILSISLLLVLSVYAKETVVYENDFTNTSLSDFSIIGEWVVSNGELTLEKGSGAAIITYNLGKEYAGKNFRVEVDFLNHTSTGGICIGATGENIDDTTGYFLGYDGFVGAMGNKGAFGLYNSDGLWAGNVATGAENIDTADLHLCAEIYGNTITYTITSLEGSTKYFGIEYTIGQSSLDIYNSLSGIVGLRKFYNDNGSFDNFKVTLIEDDEFPSTIKILTVNGTSFSSSNSLRVVSNILRGSGYAVSYSALDVNYCADFVLSPVGKTRVLFGMDNAGNGYAFEIDKDKETLSLYKLEKYEFERLGVKKVPILDDTDYNVSVRVCEGVAAVYFDAYFEGDEAFKTFEIALDDNTPGKLGFWLEGGRVKEFSLSEPDVYNGQTYTNSLVRGADPDVLFYDGTYYLYNHVNDGDNIFKVYTSADLSKWTDRGIVFTHKPDEYDTYSYMSPNVCHYEGVFYLFYAAKNTAGDQRLYCATSDSPYGPFEHKNGQTPLHEVAEIGGHPYIDESGKVYMTYVRFGGGNHIWIEEVTLKDGVVTPINGTLTKVISPEFEYEIDGYGAIAEGGVIYKHNGYYYMIYASGHYLGDYGESYAVAKDILGPYEKYDYNEILVSNSFIRGVGDGIFVPSPDETELYMVYHKHYSTSKVGERQTCIDKVKFVKDPLGGQDILIVNGPSTTPQPIPSYIGRYDIDRDGEMTLLDALKLAKHSVSAEYNGRFDVDGDGIEGALDILIVVKEVLN
ncbi:MAG: hypothetical protein E7598_02855 [Ruminococcaceae bacterium]|nr:hypothetical protein [Oscillospiraceae bacterium]